MCALLCWPVLLGQLGQKILSAPHLCCCFALPMLAYVLLAYVLVTWDLLGAVDVPDVFITSATNHTSLGALERARPLNDPPPNLSHGLPSTGSSTESTSSTEMELRRAWRDERSSPNRIWLFGLVLGAMCVWATLLRTTVRLRDAIPGSPLRDWGVAVCCCLCGVSQLARHEGLVHGAYGAFSPTGEKAVDRVEALAV